MGVGMWVFCFIYTSFELCDYAYDVLCDSLPLDVLMSMNPGLYIGGVGGYDIRLT